MSRHHHCCLAATGIILLTSAASLSACSGSDGPESAPIGSGCFGSGCVPQIDAGTPEAGGIDATDGEADGGDGGAPDAALYTQSGRLYMTKEPLFKPFLTSDTPLLGSPARVSWGVDGVAYTATYDADGGFVLKDVPAGEGSPLMVEDIDGANGVFTSLWGAKIPTPSGSFDVAVLPKAPIEQIAQSVTPPVTLDPTKGHLLITVLNSTADPTGTPFAKMAPSKPAEAVLYLTEGGKVWSRDDAAGTGTTGMAFAVNIEASPFPGDKLTLKYSMPGRNVTIPWAINIAAGAITFVYFYDADLAGD